MQNYDIRNLNKKLEEARKLLKLSQNDIGKKLNIKQNVVSKIESGQSNMKTIQYIFLLLKHGIPWEFIFEDNPKSEYPKLEYLVNEEQAEYKTKNKTNKDLQKELDIAKARIETMEHLFDKLLDKIEIKTK